MTKEQVGLTTAMPIRTIRTKAPKKTAVATAAKQALLKEAPSALALAPEAGASVAGLVAEQGALQEQERVVAEGTTFLDTARALVMHQGILGATLRTMARDSYPAEEGFVIPEEELKGYSEDEQSYMLEATSRKQFDRYKWEIGQEREDMEIAGRNGALYAVGTGIFVGLPEGVITGLGAAKALQAVGLGSRVAAQAGNVGRAVALSALENVGGNLLTTAVEDAIGGRVSAFDYAAAAGIGLVASGLSVPGLRQDAHMAMQNRMIEESVAKQRVLAERAVANLGHDASPEQIRLEVERLEGESLRQDTRVHTAALSEDRRFMPDLEKLQEEEVKPLPVQQEPTRAEVSLNVAKSRPVVEALDEIGSAPLRATRASQMLTSIAVGPGDAVVKQLAGRLMTALGDQDVPVFVLKDADIPHVSPSKVSHFDPSRNAVILNENAAKAGGEWVVTHELAHAATVFKLAAARKGVNPELSRIGAEITALREKVAGLIENQDELTKYYLKNDEEFVAGLYSGRSSFTDALKSIKLTEGKSAFNGFVDIIRRLLGLSESDMDAFTKALNLSEELIASPAEIRRFAAGVEQAPIRQAPQTAGPDVAFLQDPVAVKYGIDLMPVDTPAQRAEAKAVLAMYQRAENPAAPWNNMKPAALASMTSNSLFDLGSTSLTMLKSENPLVRMAAAELMESPTGAAGRRSTAAIAKFMYEKQFMGNVINSLQDQYKFWRGANGGNVAKDYLDGEHWARFNRLIAEEIEAVRAGEETTAPAAVKNGAAILEGAYERMRTAQVDNKTVGWGALPDSSKGYMPHRMSSSAVRNASNAQLRAFHTALVDQFVNMSGFDLSFSDKLATKYLDRVRQRAIGGYDAPGHIHQTGAADIVKDALESMGMTRDEVEAMMGRYMKGGPGFTKKRLNLNLRQEFDDGAGGTFSLMDLFETDQLSLLRSQAQRVSGEVALARHGVMGKPGLSLMRRAMEFGDTGTKAQPKELEAFDQVAAELLGDPFGNYGGKWMNRAMQATSLARLGGMGFTQFAEYINGTTAVGVGRTLAAIGSFGRLRKEAVMLAKGEKVENSIIGSLEHMGAEFGTDAYKMVFPFDNPGMQYQVNGEQTLHLSDRLLRGGLHAQGKLSFWRAIHGAQQRGMAEQIVHKAIGYINSGTELDAALKDIGISAKLAADMKAELPQIAKIENGKLVEFDITKMENKEAADEFIQAVHRGTAQIIQGTFIGETGKWAHDGWLRMLTQFRTFSITSVEKQWGRQRSNHGVGVALAMLMGSMSVAAPIYIARTYLSSVGRADQQEYLQKQLSLERIARATMNYVAMAGLAGEFLDAFSTVSGIGKNTGGRQGGTTEFAGTVVAPSVGLVDDLWRGVQNAKDGTDPHDLVKSLPFSKLPWLAPAINAMDNE